MKAMSGLSILTINSGSSSIKFAIYRPDDSGAPLVAGALDGTNLRAADASGKVLIDEPLDLADRQASAERLIGWLSSAGFLDGIGGVGYRIVHGGAQHSEPALIDDAVLAGLRTIVPLAPDHLPDEIAMVERIGKLMPGVPAVACFDTAFHRTMPRYAQVFALPRELAAGGVIRYGFHGLSYTYIVEELRRKGELPERLIVAHLGNGASMAAILNGQSIDTSMGMTPSGGFPMSCRSGDLDPGVILFLMREKKMTVDEVAAMVNDGAGLKGLSGISGDMRVLEKESPKTVFAFGYNVKKYIGAYMAALGGLDLLVFTGGIGEHSALVREYACGGLERLGIVLEAKRNTSGETVISTENSPVAVRVMRTSEEIVIARAAAWVLGASRSRNRS